MTYGKIYEFRFESKKGRDVVIEILRQNHSGGYVSRSLGAGPILTLNDSDNGICSTSLTISAECKVDQEFAIFYSSNPYEFMVKMYEYGSTIMMFEGFVATEIYSEPDRPVPYDVTIKCSDNLSQLKYVPWMPPGRATLRSQLLTCLNATGIPTSSVEVIFNNSLHPDNCSAEAMLDVTAELPYDQDTNCYDILEKILVSLNTTLRYYNGKWHVWRRNTMSVDNLPVARIGEWLPDGSLTRSVESAKRGLGATVDYFFNNELLSNADIVTDENWTKKSAAFISAIPVSERTGIVRSKKMRGFYFLHREGQISQTVNNLEKITSGAKLEIGAQLYALGKERPIVYVTIQSGNQYYDINSEGWITENKSNAIDIQKDKSLQTLSISLPFVPAGNLTLTIGAGLLPLEIYYASLSMSVPNKQVIDVEVSNQARERGSDIKLALADILDIEDYSNIERIQLNCTKYGNSFTKHWQDEAVGIEGTLADVMAVDHAITKALPRVLLSGTLIAHDVIPVWFIDTYKIEYYIRRYTYNLYEEEFQFEAVSLVNVDVKNITSNVKYYQEGLSGTSSKETSGGIAGSSGITELYDWFSKVEVGTDENDNPIWAIRANYGLFSDKFISARGAAPQGEGGSTAATLLGVWRSLANNPTLVPQENYDNVQIAASHLTTALSDYVLTSQIPTDNRQLTNGAGYITASALAGYVPSTRSIAGLTLSTDITTASLRTVLGLGSMAYESKDNYATRDFVNSSIATNTATFRGTYETVSSLPTSSVIAGLKNNDYAFVIVDGEYQRYKYTDGSWAYEYTLNNSAYTSAQWAAVNSGITTEHVTKLAGIATGAQVNVIESVKLNGTALSIVNKSVNVNAATSLTAPTGLTGGSVNASGVLPLSLTSGYEIPQSSKIKIGTLYLSDIFGIDDNGDVYLKEKSAGVWRGFYSKSFVSAKGAGSGSGGGGGTGATLLQVWRSLTNNNALPSKDSYATEQIALAHLTTALSGYALTSQIPTDNIQLANSRGFITASELNGYALTSQLNNYLPLTGGVMTLDGVITKYAYVGGTWGIPLLKYTNSNATKKFLFGAFGYSDSISYGYIGFNEYDNLNNLRIYPTAIKWGDNDILHAGNYSNYALPLSGGTLNGGLDVAGVIRATGGFIGNLTGNASTATNVSWSGITGKPTTASGYGITDAITTSNIAAQSVNYASSAGNADTLDAWHRDEIRKKALMFECLGYVSDTYTPDLNTALSSGGMIRNYYGNSYWTNSPAEFTYGTVLALMPGINSLGGQLAWDVNHGSATPTRNLYWRAADTNGWKNDWVKLIHSRNYNDEITSLTNLTKVTCSGYIDVKNNAGIQIYNSGNAYRLNFNYSNNVARIYNVVSNGESGGLLNLNYILYASYANGVGIGTTSPAYKLDVVGVIRATAGIISNSYISARNTSDMRLKNKLNQHIDYQKRLLALGDVFDYRYNELSGEDTKEQHTGLAWQTVKGVIPAMAHTRENGYGALDYISPEYINTICGAVQLTIKKQRNHEDRIKALEKENIRLKGIIRQLGGKI